MFKMLVIKIALLCTAIYCLPDPKTYIGVLAMAMYIHLTFEEEE